MIQILYLKIERIKINKLKIKSFNVKYALIITNYELYIYQSI